MAADPETILNQAKSLSEPDRFCVAWAIRQRAYGDRRSESSRTVIFHSIRVNQQWRLIFRWDGERGEAAGIYLDDHSDR